MQGELEDALGRVLRLPEAAPLTVAGRTDAGVHARGQVAHVDLPAPSWAAAQDTAAAAGRGAAAGRAGARIAAAPPGFDARFSALWRRYAYRVVDDPAGADPLRRHETLWYPRRLDVDAMNEAAGRCSASTTSPRSAAAARARPRSAPCSAWTGPGLRRGWRWRRSGRRVLPQHGPRAGRRAAAVGDGTRPAGWPAEVLAAAERDPSVPVVAPHGLCLEEVGYPPDDQLSQRALATRRVREAPGARG